jgi:hypothetical protein
MKDIDPIIIGACFVEFSIFCLADELWISCEDGIKVCGSVAATLTVGPYK